MALGWPGRIDEAEQWLDRVERAHGPAEEFEVGPVTRDDFADSPAPAPAETERRRADRSVAPAHRQTV